MQLFILYIERIKAHFFDEFKKLSINFADANNTL